MEGLDTKALDIFARDMAWSIFWRRRVYFAECRMLIVEWNYSVLGQRKYIFASLNPNLRPIANHKPYLYPKITQSARMESFYGHDYRKVGDMHFSSDLVNCSRVLQITPALLKISR